MNKASVINEEDGGQQTSALAELVGVRRGAVVVRAERALLANRVADIVVPRVEALVARIGAERVTRAAIRCGSGDAELGGTILADVGGVETGQGTHCVCTHTQHTTHTHKHN